jgi:DNA polymerase III subunit gamma/tau
MAWYNTYRPQTFEDVTGQDLVKKILQNALAKNSVRHAYLFAGSKGVGKTTLARIFARSLNDVSTNPDASIDIIEMDAASNTGIDDIRNLIESAKITPLSGPYKIFIIDEVHMLSKSAMNALLKILEEPPLYLVFLLATTNPEKLLPTIHSRLTSLKLHNHTESQIIERLSYVSQKEGITIDTDALELVAKKSEGSQRDAINLLETLASYGLESYTSKDVGEILGLIDGDILRDIHAQVVSIYKGKDPDWGTVVSTLESQGTDPDTLLIQFSDYAVTKSFEGDTSLNSLIPHLIDLQSKRLALPSIIALLGILHSYIIPGSLSFSQESSSNPEPKPSKTPPKSAPKKAEPTSPKSTDPTPENTKKPESDVSTVPEVSNSEPMPSPSDSVASKQSLSRSFQALLSSKQCPPMLKMMAGDVAIEGVEGNEVTVSSSNGIFETQLKTKAMSNLIIDHFKDNLGITVTISVTSRASNTPITNTFVSPDSEPDSSLIEVDQPLPEPETLSSLQDSPPHKNETKAGDIFYSVYRELPPEIKDSKIPVITQEIPDPTKESSDDQTDEWEKHSEEMFEFE